VIAPAAMLAVTVPEKMPVKLIVKVVLVSPLLKLTIVTVAGMPLIVRSPVVTDAGSTAMFQSTSSVCVPGPVKVPPTGGLVEVTISCVTA